MARPSSPQLVRRDDAHLPGVAGDGSRTVGGVRGTDRSTGLDGHEQTCDQGTAG